MWWQQTHLKRPPTYIYICSHFRNVCAWATQFNCYFWNALWQPDRQLLFVWSEICILLSNKSWVYWCYDLDASSWKLFLSVATDTLTADSNCKKQPNKTRQSNFIIILIQLSSVSSFIKSNKCQKLVESSNLKCFKNILMLCFSWKCRSIDITLC